MLTRANDHYKKHKNNYNENFRIRIHRALSWLNKAKSLDSDQDLDLKFISLWIGFNASYGHELSTSQSIGDKHTLKNFVTRIIESDKECLLKNIICGNYAMRIVFIIENKFTYAPFWTSVAKQGCEVWEHSFEKTIKKLQQARLDGDVYTTLSMIFDRLYTIRNQLIHGGATYNSDLNRQTLEDSVGFMNEIISAMLIIMMENYNQQQDWGQLAFPPIK